MSNAHDNTIIFAAESLVAQEVAAGRQPVFTVRAVGADKTWRERRLFEAAMLRCQVQSPETNASVERFRLENYEAV